MSNYTDYIHLAIKDPEFRIKVEQVLQEMWDNPEGAKVIAGAYNKHKDQDPAEAKKQIRHLALSIAVSHPDKTLEEDEQFVVNFLKSYQNAVGHKIVITDQKIFPELGSGYHPLTNTLVLDEEELKTFLFETDNGQLYHPSLQDVVFHELSHPDDPLSSLSCAEASIGYTFNLDKKDAIRELRIVEMTNQYIQKNYPDQAPERKGHSGTKDERYKREEVLLLKDTDSVSFSGFIDYLRGHGPLFGGASEVDEVRAQFVKDTGCKPAGKMPGVS